MKKIIFKKIDYWVAVIIIFFLSLSLSVVIGTRTTQALGFNFGGRVWYSMECESGEGLGTGCPGTCPLCTGMLGPACVAVTEIRFIPSGGTPGINFLCVPKGFPYTGGYPYIGSTITGNGLYHVLLIFQAGVR